MPSRGTRAGGGGGGGGTAAGTTYTPTDGADWPDPDPTNVQEGLDDLADRLATGEPAGTTITLDEGGVGDAAKGVYTSWGTAFAAARAIADAGVRARLAVNGTATIPAGTYNMDEIVLAGNNTGTVGSPVTCADGVVFQDPGVFDCIDLIFSNTTPAQYPITLSATKLVRVVNGANIFNAGTVAVMNVTPAITFSGFRLNDASGLRYAPHGTFEIIEVDLGATAQIVQAPFGTLVNNDTVRGAGDLLHNYDDTILVGLATQANLTGSISTTRYSKSVRNDYSPATPGDWTSPPDNPAAGLDELAGRVETIETGGSPPAAHSLGGAEHNADTLANLNAKVSDATLDDAGDARPADADAGTGFIYTPAELEDWGGAAPATLKAALDFLAANAKPPVLSGPGDAYYPASLPNIAVWLRADLGLTLGGAGAGGGTRVTNWIDQISGNDFANAADNNTNPELVTGASGINNKPAVTFDETLFQYLEALDSSKYPFGDYPFYVFAVIRPKSPLIGTFDYEAFMSIGGGNTASPNNPSVLFGVGHSNNGAPNGAITWPYNNVGVSNFGITTELMPAGSAGFGQNLWQTFHGAALQSASGADTKRARVGKGTINKITTAEQPINSAGFDSFLLGQWKQNQSFVAAASSNIDIAEIMVFTAYPDDQLMNDLNTHVESYYGFTLPTPV